jgi:hypothetical protein
MATTEAVLLPNNSTLGTNNLKPLVGALAVVVLSF